MVATALLTLCLGTAANCLGGESEDGCRANCDIEVECGFRTLAQCQAASCNVLTGAITAPGVDRCLAAADDCAAAAACACDDGCGRIDECSEAAADPDCVETCDSLVDQTPKATYLENFCRAANDDCEDLAACGSVN